jgi:threonine synthase
MATTTKDTATAKTLSTFAHLECGPLLARYDLAKAKETMTADALKTRVPTLWRYEEVLPIRDRKYMLSLGEGWSMLHAAKRLGNFIGCPNMYVKDESNNATGSFKARGLSVAVSRAYELGAMALSIPSAGNAAGAMSAYAAAGLPAFVFMPKDVPMCFQTECQQLGATLELVDGLINDCGKNAKEGVEAFGRFDVSTLKEPYRLEGKKTMGHELAEQFDWEFPDVVIYPTGGGTGLVGMWKAFGELEEMGMIGPKRPRMVSVQSTGCAPIIKAFEDGTQHVAGGTRVLTNS